MKAEIQKIMEMNKAGTLTDEQAAELLAALADGGAKPRRNGAKTEDQESETRGGHQRWHGFSQHGHWGFNEFDPHQLRRRIRHAVRHGHWDNILEGVMDGVFGGPDQVPTGGNRITRSRVEAPEGRDYVFTSNTVDCSLLAGLSLQDAEVTGNRIHSTRFANFHARAGKLTNSEFLASSANKISLDHGEITALRLRASKWRDVAVDSESALRNLACNASAIEHLTLAGKSVWTASSIHGAAISGLEIRDSTLNDLTVMAGYFKHILLDGVHADKLAMRGVGFKDSSFKKCDLKDVAFAGHAGWKWKWARYEGVQFEQCRLERVSFTECRLSKCQIRNVTVADLAIKGVDLTGQVIDGNEAFLKAVGQA